MTRLRLICTASVAALILLAVPASPAFAEEFVAGPTLKANGGTLEWTAVSGATSYEVLYATQKEYPYNWNRMSVTGLTATAPVVAGETTRYWVKSTSPSSYLSNQVFITPHLFEAEKYPDTVKSKATNPQGFQITGSVSVCQKAKFEGKSTGNSATLEVHPVYEQCEAELAGTFKAKVNTTGCNYLFHALPSDWGPYAGEGAPPGSDDIVCEPGKEIIVEIESLEGGCQIKVPAQTGLGKIQFVEEGTGSGRKTKVNANVTGIKWSATGACGLKESSGTNGEYREGKISALGIPELASGPATALTEAFTETEAAEGSWVNPPSIS